jgi:TM2 domain-containing membrane protein YozV
MIYENGQIIVKCEMCGRRYDALEAREKYEGTYEGDLYANLGFCSPKCQKKYEPIAERHRFNKWLTTLLLCLFLGGLGVHRFYTGRIVTGILQLLTFGGCYIWWLIDLIMLLTGNYRNGKGLKIARVNPYPRELELL